MNYDMKLVFQKYGNIKKMLLGLPREIWDIFLPSEEKELIDLEASIIEWRRFEETRRKVIAIQQLCGLPLRPNMTLNEAQTMARLKGIKKQRLLDELRQRNEEDEGGGQALG